ncbi:sigma-70 family RNA polymerase sigma factor [Paenibacillus sp. HJL G12]|uniref:Sigma-70 family RNA polymerase sigma factor n=1 Tax=Paenibacillus dendrobii TaxID=2691084 RepID=A0A7X3ILV3_9BACL|nr:sigma-70 family RNA polymerase sigma factor [Paenibacillus dendrobii]MWV46334.1 sigma-70 family RNA polymerase sigma factor [Paenibacillus dendrobii]
MNDQELEPWLDRLIAGDPEALEVVYGLTKKKVYGTVALLVRNQEDVNDIVSEIYVQLWRALPGYDRKRPFLFWLNGIVIRQVHNWRRQVWRRFRLHERNDRLGEFPQVEMPDEALERSESHRKIREAINRLPYKLRTVVIYRYYYDYTYEQIAELLRIPPGTAKSRVHLAIRQLRKGFDAEQDEGEFPACFKSTKLKSR